MRRSAFVIVIAVLLLAAAPAVAFAQSGGGFDLFPIVPCGTSQTQPCTACGFLDILENVVKFVTFGVTGPIAAAMFIYAGILFLFYGANVNMAARARTVMTNTVYGVTIILLAWLIVVQLIKTVAPGSAADRWYEFNCPAFFQTDGRIAGTEPPELPKQPGDPGAISELPSVVTTGACEPANIAAITGANSSLTKESQAMMELKTCLMQDPVVAQMTLVIFTYERDNPICNVTRGNNNLARACTRKTCAHGRRGTSCHYGGNSGSDGAEAGDWNVKDAVPLEYPMNPDQEVKDGSGKTVCQRNHFCGTRPDGTSYEIAAGDEAALFRELRRSAEENDCKYKLLNFEGDHTHISTRACDVDGYGVNPPPEESSAPTPAS